MVQTPSSWTPFRLAGYQLVSYWWVAASKRPTKLTAPTAKKPLGSGQLLVPWKIDSGQWQPR